jgi:hypothetical protein
MTQAARADFGSNKMGLMVEVELMIRNNFGTTPNLLNATKSPGKKLLASVTLAELAVIKANPDALEQDLQQRTENSCK